jgi:hypothetical protein
MATTETPGDLQQTKVRGVPSVSEKQKKLMRIAAHTKGGYGGVPQSVGQEFEAADEAKAKKGGKKPAWHNKLAD